MGYGVRGTGYRNKLFWYMCIILRTYLGHGRAMSEFPRQINIDWRILIISKNIVLNLVYYIWKGGPHVVGVWDWGIDAACIVKGYRDLFRILKRVPENRWVLSLCLLPGSNQIVVIIVGQMENSTLLLLYMLWQPLPLNEKVFGNRWRAYSPFITPPYAHKY